LKERFPMLKREIVESLLYEGAGVIFILILLGLQIESQEGLEFFGKTLTILLAGWLGVFLAHGIIVYFSFFREEKKKSGNKDGE
jgi:NADH:ubiquinone oxidoreductase subunit 4 (subunit M)